MMILDTNVVSELMRPAPDKAVVAWLDLQNVDDVYICLVNQAQLVTRNVKDFAHLGLTFINPWAAQENKP